MSVGLFFWGFCPSKHRIRDQMREEVETATASTLELSSEPLHEALRAALTTRHGNYCRPLFLFWSQITIQQIVGAAPGKISAFHAVHFWPVNISWKYFSEVFPAQNGISPWGDVIINFPDDIFPSIYHLPLFPFFFDISLHFSSSFSCPPLKKSHWQIPYIASSLSSSSSYRYHRPLSAIIVLFQGWQLQYFFWGGGLSAFLFL